VNLAC